MKFDLGQVVATRGVMSWIGQSTERNQAVLRCLGRHVNGDWGDLVDEDRESNDAALIDGNRVFSAYEVEDTRIWIITEWDRSVTTILFPDEY